MDRRHFLQAFGAGAACIGLPAFASHAPLCKVVGISAAGCNFATALRASNILDQTGAAVSYLCVDLGPDSLHFVEAANEAKPMQAPIKTLMLNPLRAGGNVNAARAACLRHLATLSEMFTGIDIVILFAGLDGGTGSGVTTVIDPAW